MTVKVTSWGQTWMMQMPPPRRVQDLVACSHQDPSLYQACCQWTERQLTGWMPQHPSECAASRVGCIP